MLISWRMTHERSVPHTWLGQERQRIGRIAVLLAVVMKTRHGLPLRSLETRSAGASGPGRERSWVYSGGGLAGMRHKTPAVA